MPGISIHLIISAHYKRSVAVTLLHFKTHSVPVNMSLRRLCKETGKRPSKALFYFPEENKTGIAPTRVVDNNTLLAAGKLVTVNWAGERLTAEILALNGKFVARAFRN